MIYAETWRNVMYRSQFQLIQMNETFSKVALGFNCTDQYRPWLSVLYSSIVDCRHEQGAVRQRPGADGPGHPQRRNHHLPRPLLPRLLAVLRLHRLLQGEFIFGGWYEHTRALTVSRPSGTRVSLTD